MLLLAACVHPSPPAPSTDVGGFLYAWPPPVPTEAQVAEVRACAAFTTAAARYPEAVPMDALVGAYPVANACDQAVLAAACLQRLGQEDDPSEACRDAWSAAVRGNPGYAHEAILGFTYTPYVPTFAPPPFAAGPVTKLVVDYAWSGLGEPVKWQLTVADGRATTSDGKLAPTPVNLDKVARAFTNLTPIPGAANLVNCYDNYPSWKATVTFASGEVLTLSTAGNLWGVGGPWQLEREASTWLQLDGALVTAIAGMAFDLKLPFGQPMGMFCPGIEVLDALHPPPK
jgi:hypothetical protein